MKNPEVPLRVMIANLDARSPRYENDRALLTAGERVRAEQIRVEWVRRRFVAARAFLREQLSSELGIDATEIELGEGRHGKPYLVKPHRAPGLEFNVSHSAGLALLAMTPGRSVGIDVEHVRTDIEVDALSRRFFSLREQGDLLRLSQEDRLRAFFVCWTRKEAYLKALGLGLAMPLDRFDVSIEANVDQALVADRGDVMAVDGWRLMGLNLGPALGPNNALTVEAAVAVQAQPHESIVCRLIPTSP